MDSDEEMDNFPSWKGVPGCIVLINVYDPSKQGSAPIAHAATCSLIRQNLRLANSNHVGVCVYGIEDSNSSAFGIKSVVDVCPLNSATVENFKKLRDFKVSTLKPAKEFKMSDVLWHCSKMFANCKKKLSSRTVILLSRLDEPPILSDQKPTFKRVNDLVDSHIEVKFLNISRSEYKIDKFYENFLFEASKGKGVIIPKTVWDHEELEHLMQQQTDRHLAVAKLSLEIGEGLAIGVGVYNLIKTHGNTQKKTDLLREDNAIVTSVNKTVKVTQRADAGEAMDVDDDGMAQMPLLKSELLHYQEFGGERVEFTDNEMNSLKNPFGPPMMKLLGFKPLHVLSKEKWFTKPCHFLFPNESIIEGSTVAFRALHQACLELSKVAICVLCTRVNAKPKIVALSPSSSPLGNDVEIGFDVIQLPFMENVRQIPTVDDEDTKVNAVDKSFMKEIANTVTFDYQPSLFENPKTQSTLRAIEAIALEEDDVKPFVDTTKPDPKIFEDLKADLFDEIFGPFCPTATKRAASSSSGPGGKKAKLEGMNAAEILQYRLSNKVVNDYTVKELRELLKDKGNFKTLKKFELVDLVYKYFEK